MDIHRIPNTFSNQNSAIKLHLKKYRGWLYPQHIPQIPRYIWAYYNDLTATSNTTMVNKGNHSTIALVQVSEIRWFIQTIYAWLVVWNIWIIFPIILGISFHPNWRSFHDFSEGFCEKTTNQSFIELDDGNFNRKPQPFLNRPMFGPNFGCSLGRR